MDGQLDLFDYAARQPALPVNPVDAWRSERAEMIERLAQKIGVPLQREVEVWLTQGIRLRGIVRLADEHLWVTGERDKIVLQIGKATFRLGDLESLVKL